MKLTLGPVAGAWPRARLATFYRDVAKAPVDTVVLDVAPGGHDDRFGLRDWLGTAERLAGAGKQVVLGAQALVESNADVRTLRRIARDGPFLVEANDMGAVQMLADHARFVAGPRLNVYHADMLAFLVSAGAMRWVPPPEATYASIEAIVKSCLPPEIEACAWGRMPLDFVPDCAPATRCALLASRERRRATGADAPAAHPYRLCCLVESMPALERIHVDAVRVDPQVSRMPDVLHGVRAALDGTLAARASAKLIAADAASLACDPVGDEVSSDAQMASHAPNMIRIV